MRSLVKAWRDSRLTQEKCLLWVLEVKAEFWSHFSLLSLSLSCALTLLLSLWLWRDYFGISTYGFTVVVWSTFWVACSILFNASILLKHVFQGCGICFKKKKNVVINYEECCTLNHLFEVISLQTLTLYSQWGISSLIRAASFT